MSTSTPPVLDMVRTPRTNDGSILRLALLASIVISFLAASAAPTPLYQHYDRIWHGTALTTTEAFGVYAVAVLGGLLVLGGAATHLGRRPVLLAALGLQGVALVLFATAGSFEPLFIGRVLQGIAAGAGLGTLGAAMIEAHQEHGTVASSAAPGAGTGIGALAAGIAVSYLPWPTHLIYLALIAVLTLQAVGVLTLLEATPTRRGLLASLRPRIAVPAAARGAFTAAAPAAFAVWALAGLYGSLGPAVLRAMSPHSPTVLGGFVLFELAIVGSVTTIVLRSHDGRRQMTTGLVAMIVGVAWLATSIATGSVVGFLLATVVAGVGFGSGLQGSIRTTVPLAEPHERAGLLAAVYLVSYAGMGVPAVAAGFAVSHGTGLTATAVAYAIGVITLGLGAFALLGLRAGQ
ncbi:MFS transporter [Nocardioides sp.]|jgi:predicted MFS family arabinose efflux permease|uniref:MFS transporter n=1 Tax=Nocardioides sp. TaxID=35761 RepID=UPI002CC919EE|nr:MFS transporter [Nocardioides sp.]HVX54381.1 MFS transporter [Nocardioides sp.]